MRIWARSDSNITMLCFAALCDEGLPIVTMRWPPDSIIITRGVGLPEGSFDTLRETGVGPSERGALGDMRHWRRVGG